ncbi:restriction endonuclease subunit S [Treponema porcinum]|uniref:Type I restriction enzyme, S subunit n=1 Tax=Treponema porcinum TaxID=261392 RepID=A0A1T4JQF2_TREPO|nr:restriction endonuclease subunit S [Treponema porcinum]SJZ32384.1 type I restriction enzyme, S subunit [Treponema porcinum]
MSTNYKKLGDIVELIDERNKSLETSEVLGISIDKEFMPSVANTIGTDLSNYKLLRMNTFACNPMHVGRDERLPVSLYKKDIPAIVSPAYFMFRVKDENKVIPDFLMLIFKRNDFDRNCWFRTDGSVRGGITWDDICEIKLPVPDIKEQQKIVDTYNAITNRIRIKQKINENLEKTAQCLFEEIYSNREDWNDGIISDLGEIIGGATPSTEVKEYFCDKGIPWLSPKDLTSTGYKYISKGETDITEEGYKSCSTKLMPKGTVLLTSRAPVGCLAIAENDICTNQGFKSLVPKKDIGTAYVYYFLKSEVDMLKQNASGTTFDEISGSVIKNLKCKIPPANIALDFNEKCKPIFNYQRTIENEIKELVELRQFVVSQISKR